MTRLRPRTVTLLASGAALDFQFEGNVLTVNLPAAMRTRVVDVVRVEL